MRIGRRAARALCLVILLVGPGRIALGQPAPEERRWLLFHIAAPEAVVEALAERLRPELGRQNVDLVVKTAETVDIDQVLGASPHAGTGTTPLAEVWLDGRLPADVKILVVPPPGDRVLAHRLALPVGFDEVAMAEIVFLIERAATALLDAQSVGVPREEARAMLRSPGRADAADSPETAVSGSPASLPRANEPPAPTVQRSAPRLELLLGAAIGSEGFSSGNAFVPTVDLAAIVERMRGEAGAGMAIEVQWRRGFE